MVEFRPINTQEEFDAAISKRLAREREAGRREAEASLTEKYGDYDTIKNQLSEKDIKLTELGNQLAESQKSTEQFTAQIEELQTKVRIHEANSVKMGLANKYGLPAELANRISGETAEEMEADAEKLHTLFGKSKVIQVPIGTSGEQTTNIKEQALKGMLSELKGL